METLYISLIGLFSSLTFWLYHLHHENGKQLSYPYAAFSKHQILTNPWVLSLAPLYYFHRVSIFLKIV